VGENGMEERALRTAAALGLAKPRAGSDYVGCRGWLICVMVLLAKSRIIKYYMSKQIGYSS